MKPRLPVYTIQINLYPLLSFVKSPITHHWQTILSTNIHFYNENYLHLSVYAMNFDAYIERYDTTSEKNVVDVDDDHSTGIITALDRPKPQASSSIPASLLHMATITDQNQHMTRSIVNSTYINHNNALWSIPGRTNFTIQHCPLYMSFFDASSTTTAVNNASTMTYIRSILLLTYKLISYTIHKLWDNNGQMSTTFTIPTTGVARIRASLWSNNNHRNHTATAAAAAMPFTVGMICNNEISLWQLQIIGIQCQQHIMIPGWNEPISIVAAQLRNYAVTKLRIQNTTTGSVIS